MDDATGIEKTALGRGWNGFGMEFILTARALIKGDPRIKVAMPSGPMHSPCTGKSCNRRGRVGDPVQAPLLPRQSGTILNPSLLLVPKWSSATVRRINQ